MVNACDLKLSQADLEDAIRGLRLEDSIESSIDFFATLAWTVICEPGDGFAGQLIETFGPAEALKFEIERLSATNYVHKFADAGSDFVEMQAFGTFEKTLHDARERWSGRFSIARVIDAATRMKTLDGWFITRDSQHWPRSLDDLGRHSPRGLWGKGGPGYLKNPAISIVGSRMATAYGEYATGEVIGPLARQGYSIVSGGAYGIDAMAHRATLALGGVTIAVMAGGLDRLYPSGNRDLFRQIEESGAIISEMPPGAEPTKWRFLQRNRLIAGIGLATVVIEANPKSGAISTANRAIELERPLGAVPGPLNSPGSDGCHKLIRDSAATLITCAEDVLELITGGQICRGGELPGLGALETRVNDVIGFGRADLTKICAEAGLTRSEAQIGLAGLKLLGLIEEGSAGWQRKQ